MQVKAAQSCLTPCDPMDYIVLGILQARILEWVAFPFSRGSCQPRDQTQVSRIAGRSFTSWATRETFGQRLISSLLNKLRVTHENIELSALANWQNMQHIFSHLQFSYKTPIKFRVLKIYLTSHFLISNYTKKLENSEQ